MPIPIAICQEHKLQGDRMLGSEVKKDQPGLVFEWEILV